MLHSCEWVTMVKTIGDRCGGQYRNGVFLNEKRKTKNEKLKEKAEAKAEAKAKHEKRYAE